MRETPLEDGGFDLRQLWNRYTRQYAHALSRYAKKISNIQYRHVFRSCSGDQVSGHVKLFGVIDLRSLQLVGVIDVDGFPGGEEIDGAIAFAMSVAGVLYAAEG